MPTTFQCCMISIFFDFLEEIMEVFMDDFSVYESSFDDCLANLEKVLKRCLKINMVLKLGEMPLHGERGNSP